MARRDESLRFGNERESGVQQGTWVSEAGRSLYVYVGRAPHVANEWREAALRAAAGAAPQFMRLFGSTSPPVTTPSSRTGMR